MIKFFRKIRQGLLREGKTAQYAKYALGEIVLVVVGILIALNINNWNEATHDRNREIKYLNSLRADLTHDLINLERISNTAHRKTVFAVKIMALEPPKNQRELFILDSMLLRVSVWNTFKQRASTIDELTSSGNLSLIKNDSIKSLMLSIKQRNVFLKTIDNHIREEFDKFIYPTVAEDYEEFAFFNMQKLAENDTIVWEKSIEEQRVPVLLKKAETLLKNEVFQNGLRLAAVNFKGARINYEPMITETKKLISLIDEELKEK